MVIGSMGHSNWAGVAHKGSVGTTTYALLQNAAGQTILNSASGEKINFNQGNVNKMVLNSGNLGIGLSDPTEKLDVNGNAKISNNLYLPKIKSTASFERKILAINDNTEGRVMQISSSTILDYCKLVNSAVNNVTPSGNNTGTLVDLTNFGGATTGKYYVDLQFYTSSYGTRASLKIAVDLDNTLIRIIGYTHFNGGSYDTVGDGTSVVTSVSSSFAKVEISIVGNILKFRQLSSAAGGGGWTQCTGKYGVYPLPWGYKF